MKKVLFTVSDSKAVSLLKWGDFCMGFLLLLPIVVLFYQDRGISLGDFFLIQGIFGLINFLFQIPSGYMSDVFSRKKIMLGGSVLWFVALALLIFAYGFWQILLAEIIMGMATAMFHGTKESYAYDLLKRMRRQKDFLKEYGSINTYNVVAMFIAVLIGGWLYANIGNWLTVINAFVGFLGILCVMLLPELREVGRRAANPVKDMMGVVRSAVKRSDLKWLMIFPALFGTFTLIMMWILQPTMAAAGVPVAMFGVFVGINALGRIVFTKYAYLIQKFMGLKNSIYMSVSAVVISVFMVFGALWSGGNLWLVYAFCAVLAIVPAVQRLNKISFNALMHHKVKSTERATILSVSEMYGRFFSSGAMILMKPLLDGFGIEWTMVIVLVMFSAILWPLKKVVSG